MRGKRITANGMVLVAACDAALIGKTLRENEIQLEITEQFYGKEEITPYQLGQMMEDAHSINLLGEEAVGVALKKGVAHKEDVRMFANTPHVQVYRV